MRARLIALRERRAHLVAQAETQREAALAMIERAEVATDWLNRANAAGRWLRERPVLIAAGVMLLVVLRPRRTLKWFATGVSVWRSWRSLRGFLEQITGGRATVSGTFRP